MCVVSRLSARRRTRFVVFVATDIDVLAIGCCYLRKETQTVDARDFRVGFEPD